MTRALAATALAALVIAGAGGAMPTWTTPRVISGGADGLALLPELAVNASGTAIAVWDRETGPDCAEAPASLTCIHTIEEVSRASAGAAWGSPIPINRPGVDARPRAAIDDAGDAALLWIHDIGRDRVVQATLRRGPNGVFPNAEDLSKEVMAVRSHQIVLDAGGDAVAAWAQRVGDTFEVRAAVRPAARGYWGAAELLSTQGVTGGPSLAVTAGGRMLIAWTENGVVRAATGDIHAGAWDAPVRLSNSFGESMWDPAVAVNAGGDGVVAWQRRDRPRGTSIVQAVTGSVFAGWGPRLDVGDAGTGFNGRPQVALAPNGDAVALWPLGAVDAPVRSAEFSRGGAAWSQPVAIPGSAGAAEPQLAVDQSGNRVAVWIDGASKAAKAAVAPAAADAWQPPAIVSGATAVGPRVAADADGRGVAIWNLSVGQRTDVEGVDLNGGWELTLANTERPSIQGRPRVGQALICRRGTWAGTVPIRYAYAWLRNGRQLHGSDGLWYVIRRADRGGLLACRVTATNAARTVAATSRPVRVRVG